MFLLLYEFEVRNILDRARRAQAVRLQKVKNVKAKDLTDLQEDDFDGKYE